MRTPEPHRHVAPEEGSLESPDLVTRVPVPDDLGTLVAIDATWSGHERRSYLEGRLKRVLRPAGISLARIAEHKDEVVGFLFGDVTRGEFGRVATIAWIDTLGVRRDWVRRGVASLLLTDFMRHAEVLGVESVRTLLDPEDETLTEFLEAHQFRVAPTKVVERRLQGGR